jgi:hypothetical protein
MCCRAWSTRVLIYSCVERRAHSMKEARLVTTESMTTFTHAPLPFPPVTSCHTPSHSGVNQHNGGVDIEHAGTALIHSVVSSHHGGHVPPNAVHNTATRMQGPQSYSSANRDLPSVASWTDGHTSNSVLRCVGGSIHRDGTRVGRLDRHHL